MAVNTLKPNQHFLCEQCGISCAVYRSPSVKPARFCSLICLGIAQRGTGNPAYTGGRYKDSNGYIHLFLPGHPASDVRGYVYEHRLVAERIKGCLLAPEEVVHHLNEIKDDNRPENIVIYPNNAAHMIVNHPSTNPRPARGERHGMAKLTWDDVHIIRQRYSQGTSRSILAEMFHISPGHVNDIVREKAWRNISNES